MSVSRYRAARPSAGLSHVASTLRILLDGTETRTRLISSFPRQHSPSLFCSRGPEKGNRQAAVWDLSLLSVSSFTQGKQKAGLVVNPGRNPPTPPFLSLPSSPPHLFPRNPILACLCIGQPPLFCSPIPPCDNRLSATCPLGAQRYQDTPPRASFHVSFPPSFY